MAGAPETGPSGDSGEEAEEKGGGAAPAEAVRPGDFVAVHGLTSEGGRKLNGARGAVFRADEAKGRLEVFLSAEKLTSLKPENLKTLDDDARLASLQDAILAMLTSPAVAGVLHRVREDACDRAEFEELLDGVLREFLEPEYRRHGVDRAWHLQRASAGGAVERERRVAALLDFGAHGPSALERGELCEVRGLASEAGRALNGAVVAVRGWDGASGRYRVELVGGAADAKALRPENIATIDARTDLSADDARALLRALRDTTCRPDALHELGRLLDLDMMGQPSGAASAAARKAALRIQVPALQICGLRPDAAGQRDMRAAFHRFSGDPAVVRELAAATPLPRCDEKDAAPAVVFLDVDGVLHSLHGDDIFRDDCCALLEFVLKSTGARVVLSSTWRLERDKVAMIDNLLTERGMQRILGCTKDLGTHREEEICEWLDRHPATPRWVALDDMDLVCRTTPAAARLVGHFVRTSQRTGLTADLAQLAVGLLEAQRLDGAALRAARALAAEGPGAVAAAIEAGGLGPTEAEAALLARLCMACGEEAAGDAAAAARASLAELAAPIGVHPELLRALARDNLGSTEALAGLPAPSEFEPRVLGLWYDPDDGGGERCTTREEKEGLRRLYEACRREAGLPPGPYAPGAGARWPPAGLRRRGVALGAPAALVDALVETLAALGGCASRADSGAGTPSRELPADVKPKDASVLC